MGSLKYSAGRTLLEKHSLSVASPATAGKACGASSSQLSSSRYRRISFDVKIQYLKQSMSVAGFSTATALRATPSSAASESSSSQAASAQDAQQPPRPPNSWILYRAVKSRELAQNQVVTASSIEHDSRQGRGAQTKIISRMWRNEPASIREHYEQLAEQKKQEHLARYPGYKYQPKRRSRAKKATDSPPGLPDPGSHRFAASDSQGTQRRQQGPSHATHYATEPAMWAVGKGQGEGSGPSSVPYSQTFAMAQHMAEQVYHPPSHTESHPGHPRSAQQGTSSTTPNIYSNESHTRFLPYPPRHFYGAVAPSHSSALTAPLGQSYYSSP
ncbi:hypothetical protein A4X13_0g8189 [Tilletia indica]|uniref:HMG box domain-containing protein n=1 Tax=Tilletia indica TaxID=43049 RepID=A0A8T8SG04_9BASI|nr:hypothetical protein A4X13_0g8189 [Tilletia indica]